MKKLLLFLLIFALFLTGCNTPVPDEGGNETPDAQQNSGDTSDSENNQSNEKVPASQITNEGQPQDENDEFLFVFKGKSGYFARGERLELEVELTNNTGEALPLDNHSQFTATIELFCMINGEKHVIEHELTTVSWGKIEGFQIEAGESFSSTFYYNIPSDAPIGEYTLRCSYKDTTTEFEGYFTLTQ